jgi:phospholipase/carboxylesterase
MGLVMRAWYDIRTIDVGDQDERGIRRSDEAIRALIDREVERGIPARRIVLAGFSQGGAMALFAGLRHPERLAGILCLSGYLLLADALTTEASAANRSVPILQAHGMYDDVVPLELGLRGSERLTECGYDVDWREYPMAHQVCLEELRDIGEWMGRVLAKTAV